jgi:pimeloyl-ACP methyl ester carboxylesterase
VPQADLGENQFVTVDGKRLRYIEAGSGPPILFQAGLGFGASSDQFVPTMRLLADHYRVISLDRFGWGLSDRPASGYSFEAWTASTLGFMDALGIERTTLVGHTLGGWVSALIAYEYPERVEKLVLANTAGLNTRAPTPAQDYKVPDREGLRDELERTFAGAIEITDELVDEQVARSQVAGAAEAYTAILSYVNDPDVRKAFWLPDRLAKVQAPTLVVWGADDHIIGPEHGQQAADLLPNGSLVLVERGEHIPPARKPEEFAAIMQQFMG